MISRLFAMLALVLLGSCGKHVSSSSLPTIFAISSNSLTSLVPGPGSGVQWLLQGSNYSFTWDLSNPNNKDVKWLCQIQSIELHMSDPNYISPGSTCENFPGFTIESTGKYSYSASILAPATLRGVFKIQLSAADLSGNVGAKESFYIGIRENWVSNGALAMLDGTFARSITGDKGESLIVPATHGCNITEWVDLSGNSNSGDLKNYSECSAGNGWTGTGDATAPYAIAMDGSNRGHVELRNENNFDIPTGSEITLEIFFKTQSEAHQALFHKWYWTGATNGPSGYTLEFLDNIDRPLYVLPNLTNSFGGFSTMSVTLNNWYHLVMTFNDTTNDSRIYVNSNEPTVSAQTLNLRANDAILNIGRRSDTELRAPDATKGSLDGQITRAVVYNRALSHAEIRQNCNAFKSRFSDLICN